MLCPPGFIIFINPFYLLIFYCLYFFLCISSSEGSSGVASFGFFDVARLLFFCARAGFLESCLLNLFLVCYYYCFVLIYLLIFLPGVCYGTPLVVPFLRARPFLAPSSLSCLLRFWPIFFLFLPPPFFSDLFYYFPPYSYVSFYWVPLISGSAASPLPLPGLLFWSLTPPLYYGGYLPHTPARYSCVA